MKDVGEKIRQQRLSKKYSQEYMAFMLNISQAAYSKIERDETELTIQRILDIGEILEINPYTLLPKPKHGSGINFYSRTLIKLLRFFRRSRAREIAAKSDTYKGSKGQIK